MIHALKCNWKVYLMEALCLGSFMLSACVFATLLEAPDSPVRRTLPNGFFRLVLMGIAMGVTAVLINYSPMGKLSGAHMNPAVTVTFYRLQKIALTDAIFYILFQCAGGLLAVVAVKGLLGSFFTSPPVNGIVTAPGSDGSLMAFVAEVIMAFGMMLMVLTTSNHPRLARFTGVLAGVLVMSFVILSSPVSGFSINPARTLSSAIPAMAFPSLWIYMTAPFIGMLGAAALYRKAKGVVMCAKMHHDSAYDCIFNCGYCVHDESSDAKADPISES